jgi:broad specificity phosphatase PhoE
MNILLARHGQAGTRLAYDQLSTTGTRQASLLGKFFKDSGWNFDRWIAGGLNRQQQTAHLAAAGAEVDPERILVDELWNEFDLDRVYHGIGPRLAGLNADFRTHWESVQALVATHGSDETALVNRRWSPADEMVVRAWVRQEIEYEGESWTGFRARIGGALHRVLESGAESAVIFTSATPIAICVGGALSLADSDIFQLAGAQMNSSLTELRWRHGKLRLFSFNNVPHLTEAALRTHR